jgi:hypothetical protein
MATSGTTTKISVFLMTPGLEPLPFKRADVERMVFDSTNPASLYNYFAEVSGGVNRSSSQRHVRIGGRVTDWGKMRKNYASDYSPGKTENMCADVIASGTDAILKKNNPAAYYLYVFNGLGGGDSYQCAGANTGVVGSADMEFTPRPYSTIAHELGHLLGLAHEGRLYCKDGLPQKVTEFKSACSIDQYASSSNLMGASDLGHHFSGFQKWQLGFISSSRVVRNVVRSGSVDKTFDIEDSTARRSGTQLVTLPFDNADNMYLLQYRTAQGLDAELTEGVYVYIIAGQNDLGIQDGVLVHRRLSEPVVLNENNTTYVDPHRKLEFTFQQSDGVKARVRVVRNDNVGAG